MLNVGKLSELILKRSVLNKFRNKREEVLSGAKAGADAAVMLVKGQLVTAVSCSSVEYETLLDAKITMTRAVNSVAAEGGSPFAVLVSMIVPPETEESRIKSIMEVLEETKDGEGIGEVGYLPAATTVTALVVLIKEKFDLKNVILYGNPNDTVEKIAICPGSGKSVINEAVQKKADCLITGDIGHHEGLDANEMGLTILDASHYGLEHIFMHIMYEYLKGYCMDVEIGIADVGVPFSIL